jgi:hypothetical protein
LSALMNGRPLFGASAASLVRSPRYSSSSLAAPGSGHVNGSALGLGVAFLAALLAAGLLAAALVALAGAAGAGSAASNRASASSRLTLS